MKRFGRFFESIAALTSLLWLTGCFPNATLQVEKEIPTPPTQPISLTITIAEGVQMPAEDLNTFRVHIVDSLAFVGIRVSPNSKFSVKGTVTRYEPGSQFVRWLFGPLSPGYFDSTWIVLDENGSEIGNAHISGEVYMGRMGGNYDRVMQNVGERLAEFLTKMHEAPILKTEKPK